MQRRVIDQFDRGERARAVTQGARELAQVRAQRRSVVTQALRVQMQALAAVLESQT
jgi:hypothetical protein